MVSASAVAAVVGGGVVSGVGGGGGNDRGKVWQPASCAASIQISHLKALVRIINEDPILGNFTALRYRRRSCLS